VAVLGDGKLGLLVAQVLQLHGARVTLFGHHRSKMEIAVKVGVRRGVNGGRFDWVVEATGTAEGLREAARMVRPRGTLILKSTIHGLVSLDVSALVVDEVTIIGSRCGRFEPALKLLEGGELRLSEMISGRFALGEAPAAFERAMERGALKVLLDARV
jgi:alcohol dehydrogenase